MASVDAARSCLVHHWQRKGLHRGLPTRTLTSMNPCCVAFQVHALVRQREGTETAAIPQSAQLVYGDLGDYQACREAVRGVDKVRSHILFDRSCVCMPRQQHMLMYFLTN